MPKFLKIALAIQFLGAAAAAVQAEPAVTINAASPFKEGHILCDAARNFKEIIEKESGGRIAVNLRFGAGSEEDVSDRCARGEIDLQANSPRPIEVYAPQYFFINNPYVMKDFDHFMRVWNGPIGKQAKKIVEEKGNMIYAGVVSRGLRQMTANRPIRTDKDLYGLKLRLPVNKTWVATWKGLGVDPVQILLPDLYNALKKGTAEASEGDLTQISSFNLQEVQSYLVLTNHHVQTGGLIINRSFFNKLSESDRRLVLKAVGEACGRANKYMKENESAILSDLQKKGMKIIIPDADAMREKAKPAIEELFKTEWPVTTWKEILAQ
jgi:TRAP-type C4-dicarboxylate transport system substrate-binding protein